MKLLLPDLDYRSPTVLPKAKEISCFLESFEVQNTCKVPRGLFASEYVANKIGVRVLDGMPSPGGYLRVAVHDKNGPGQRVRLDLFYLTALWPQLFEIGPALRICYGEDLVFETDRPVFLTIGGAQQ